jgi:hypothetical protein
MEWLPEADMSCDSLAAYVHVNSHLLSDLFRFNHFVLLHL